MADSKTLVLGIGNTFRRDDGIGPAVISRLRSKNSLEHVDFIDGGPDDLSLIEYIQGYKKIIIVDAVDMGMPPGEVRVFSPGEANLKIKTSFSTHGFGLSDIIILMQTLGMQTSNIHIVGVQAKDTSFGEELSQEVSCKIEEINGLIKEICEGAIK